MSKTESMPVARSESESDETAAYTMWRGELIKKRRCCAGCGGGLTLQDT